MARWCLPLSIGVSCDESVDTVDGGLLSWIATWNRRWLNSKKRAAIKKAGDGSYLAELHIESKIHRCIKCSYECRRCQQLMRVKTTSNDSNM
jgi:hypothetical protein